MTARRRAGIYTRARYTTESERLVGTGATVGWRRVDVLEDRLVGSAGAAGTLEDSDIAGLAGSVIATDDGYASRQERWPVKDGFDMEA